MKTKYKIFFGKLIFHILSLFLPQRIQVLRNNIKWDLDLSEGIDLHIFIFGAFETEIVKCAKKLKLNKFNNIIDIGANFGAQTLQIADEFKNSKIFSIEPTNYAYEKLSKNINLNKELKKNISTHKLFLGSENQEKPDGIYSSWNLNSKKTKHATHLGEKKDTDNSQSKTLDQFIIENKIYELDFIKLDVDGYEYYVLKGGFNFLKKKKPPIFMELAPYLYDEYGYNQERIINLIKSLNYEFYDLKNLKKIINIKKKIDKIKYGSSENILLM